MAGARRGSFRICGLAAAFCVGAGAMLVAPVPGQAQGLFDLLNSIVRGMAPRTYRSEPPRLLEGFPGDGYEETLEGPGGPYVSYCVRLCDGRYFPLPRNAGGPSMNAAQMCSAMCPAAKTKIFSGTQIGRAVARDGKNYSSLANAFVYRERIVSDCSCNGRDTAGIAAMEVEADPTLRPGDIVVTSEGPKVYTGNRRTPHQVSNFVPAEDYRGLPKSVRQNLSEMRVAPERLSATVKTGTSAPAQPTSAPALTLAPDGGETMLGENPGRQN